MKPLSIRTSLTLWLVGLTGLLLAAFAVTVYGSMRHTLVAGFDGRVQTRAEAVAAFCEWESDVGGADFDMPPEVVASFLGGAAGRGVDVRTWPEGKVLYASGLTFAPGPATAAAAPAGGNVELAFVAGDGSRRQCTIRRALPGAPDDATDREVVVRVAESFEPVRRQLQRAGQVILLLTALAAAVVVALGAWFSRRFVRPLRELGEAARAVDPSRSTPMPRRGNDDEVDHLAAILDRTFDSLRDALDRQARFTADAAHELRNPVSVIRNAADVALREGRGQQEVRVLLVDILETAKRMGAVVQSLLTLARLDASSVLEVADVELGQVVATAVAARPQDRDRVAVHVEAPVVIRGERGLLLVLADNLIANALHHSRGARVEVHVAPAAGGGATLAVRDYGPGLPSVARQDVFRRFHRGGAAGGGDGAGLGLSIVAAIAAAHGATCRLEDARPGARVLVVFPDVPGPPRGNRPLVQTGLRSGS